MLSCLKSNANPSAKRTAGQHPRGRLRESVHSVNTPPTRAFVSHTVPIPGQNSALGRDPTSRLSHAAGSLPAGTSRLAYDCSDCRIADMISGRSAGETPALSTEQRNWRSTLNVKLVHWANESTGLGEVVHLQNNGNGLAKHLLPCKARRPVCEHGHANSFSYPHRASRSAR